MDSKYTHTHAHTSQPMFHRGLKQNLLEGPPEVPVENSVYDGVQAAVAVPDPEEEVEECVRYRTFLSADSVEAVSKEEWEPAENETPHHHCQNKREALLSHLCNFVFGQRNLMSSEKHRRRQEKVVGAVVR